MIKTVKDSFANEKAFIPFITAGDAGLDNTEKFILEMEKAGADLVEIGIPFSDPVAEGTVIQEADIRSLANGTTTDGIFDMVKDLRTKTDMPLVFMTYLNPVFSYGYERFFGKCEEVGVSGIIIPDLPYEEMGECSDIAKSHGVDIISMIAPTSKESVRMIAQEAKGFIYLVSSMGVTGMRNKITTDLAPIIELIREVTDTPVAIGFGIHSPEQAGEMCKIADGVISGSAVVKLVEKYGDNAGPYIYEFVKQMKEGEEACA